MPTSIIAACIIAVGLIVGGFLAGGPYEAISVNGGGTFYLVNRYTGAFDLCTAAGCQWRSKVPQQ